MGTAAGAPDARLARIAASRRFFCLAGWDTHTGQERVLERQLGQLAEGLVAFAEADPAVWQKTMVVCVTEFGRTVAGNGTGGTDHGTGGAMLIAGGAVRGGRVHGDWPGLEEADLYQRRDLMPAADLRVQLAWMLHGLTGAGVDVLASTVFPGADMGRDPGLLR